MFGYKLDIEHICTENKESDEPYGDWYRDYSNDFKEIRKESTYPEISSSLDILPGTIVYVVWAEWSTGDSFGHSENSESEGMGVFLDTKSAIEFKEFLESNSSSNYNFKEDTKNFVSSDGQEFKFRNFPWSGYFESLSAIHLETTIMEEEI